MEFFVFVLTLVEGQMFGLRDNKKNPCMPPTRSLGSAVGPVWNTANYGDGPALLYPCVPPVVKLLHAFNACAESNRRPFSLFFFFLSCFFRAGVSFTDERVCLLVVASLFLDQFHAQ